MPTYSRAVFELTPLGVYMCIAPTGLVPLLARRPTSLDVRAAKPHDDKQVHHHDQKAQDAVHCPLGVTMPICGTRVENVARRLAPGTSPSFPGKPARPREALGSRPGFIRPSVSCLP